MKTIKFCIISVFLLAGGFLLYSGAMTVAWLPSAEEDPRIYGAASALFIIGIVANVLGAAIMTVALVSKVWDWLSRKRKGYRLRRE